MEEKKLTDEEIIHNLEEFASDSDMNETGIYAEILDLIHRLQNKIKEQDKEYIELDLECRELRTNLDKELAEHEEFTKKAKEKIEQLEKSSKAVCGRAGEILTEYVKLKQERVALKKEQVIECYGILKGCDMVKQAVKDTADKIVCGLLELFPKGHTSTVITLASIHRIVKEATDGVGVE